MSTAFDSQMLGPLFGDEEIAPLFSDQAHVRALVEVEIALARAEARLGVIPEAAAEGIAALDAAKIDLAVLAKGSARSGFPIIALVSEIRRLAAPEAAPYVHWGATTQDIMDTACVLRLVAAAKILDRRLKQTIGHLADLADRHRHTVMAARTHSQQALPTTFGLKAAGWLGPLVRHAERLRELSPRLGVVQFGGAAGTLAALGTSGLAVAEALAAELGLKPVVTPWHAQRDNMAEFAGWLSLLSGSLGKMAQDIILMAQTEVGEIGESGETGRGGSSTMPQKSNPVTSELIVAAARANASLLGTMHQALIQEHERGTHGWQLEWLTLPQMVLLTGGALKHGLFLARNMQVDASAMNENMRRANDALLAEAAVFALARVMAREEAEALVKQACAAARGGKPLIDAVRSLAGDAVKPDAVDWQALARPENYLGAGDALIDRVLQTVRNLS